MTIAIPVKPERAAPAARRQSLIVPREHGAWGILLIPLVTGAAAGIRTGAAAWALVPLTLTALSLFWLRTPLESWIGASPVRARTPAEFRLVRTASVILALISLTALAWLFWPGRNGGLLWVGAISGIALGGQAAVKRISRSARAAAQMIGSVGLTATGPAAYYVVSGHLDWMAWTLWAANLLFAINQIQYVQLRIRAARAASVHEKLVAGRWFVAAQVALAAVLLAACAAHRFPWLAAGAYLPVLYRGFAWFAAKAEVLAVHALGKSELAYACTFGVLLVLGMRP